MCCSTQSPKYSSLGAGGMSNFNDLMAQMGGMQGGDGKPSFDDLEGEEDSDDEPLPDLEGAQEKK